MSHYVLLPRNRQRIGVSADNLFQPNTADIAQMNQVHEMELYERVKSWTYALLSGINDHYHRIRTELENEKVLIKKPNDFLCIAMYLRAYTHVVCRTIDALSFVKVNNQVIRPDQITQELVDCHRSEQFQELLSWTEYKVSDVINRETYRNIITFQDAIIRIHSHFNEWCANNYSTPHQGDLASLFYYPLKANAGEIHRPSDQRLV